MDAADIAWKLALVVRCAAQPSLLDSHGTDRGVADHHVLEVSHEVHSLVMDLVAMCDGGGAPTLPQGDPAQNVAAARRRSMLDVSYGKRARRSGRRSRRTTITRRSLPGLPLPKRYVPSDRIRRGASLGLSPRALG